MDQHGGIGPDLEPDELLFSFRLTPSDYRAMLYFNNFGRQRWHAIFLILSWILSFTLLMLERFALVPPLEKVTHACLLLVSVAVPALILTTEFAVYRFRKNNPQEFQDIRGAYFSREAVEFSFSGQGRHKAIREEWRAFSQVYETRGMFLLYRDKRSMSLIPKRGIPAPALPLLRQLLRERVGRT